MTTLADIAADIADDIDDTTGEYADAIIKAVQGAQRYCERSLYYFNETRDETFTTVADQDWYDASDNANIPTLVRIQAVYVTDSGNQINEVFRTTPEQLELLMDGSAASGKPVWWTYFAQKIRLYPKPNAAYTIRLQIGPYRLTPLSDPSDTNTWLTEAYDLIKARAKYIVFKNTLKDPGLAAEALADYNDQHSELKAETSRRNGSGYIKPTHF